MTCLLYTSSVRSTLATYTGIYSLLRLLFSRAGKPFVGYSDTFSFNLPQGMCPRCQGLGYVDDLSLIHICGYRVRRRTIPVPGHFPINNSYTVGLTRK